jgi:tetratricopeptide (TPR) repeat protein
MLAAIRAIVYAASLAIVAGCLNSVLQAANQQQLKHQQDELNQLKQEVAALQTPPGANHYPSLPSGSCDTNIMKVATRKGGERFAAGDFSEALNYYEDAVTACPSSARANVNLARAYEAVGDRQQAVSHYKIAANASGSDTDPDAVRQARTSLERLGN